MKKIIASCKVFAQRRRWQQLWQHHNKQIFSLKKPYILSLYDLNSELLKKESLSTLRMTFGPFCSLIKKSWSVLIFRISLLHLTVPAMFTVESRRKLDLFKRMSHMEVSETLQFGTQLLPLCNSIRINWWMHSLVANGYVWKEYVKMAQFR